MAKKLLNITEIEDRTKVLVENLNKSTFIIDFVSLFDITKTTITRASKVASDDFIIKNRLYFRKVENQPLLALTEIDKELDGQVRKSRFIITTDFQELYAKDTQTGLTLAISFNDLPAHCDFFLPWNGIEKIDYDKENPADVKAAERFTKLYDELISINPELAITETDGKSFNLFLIRVLFLLFAEDTSIISKGAFSNVIKMRTSEDGSDLNECVRKLFTVLDMPEFSRQDLESWLSDFPYVNGKLFSEPHHDLIFNKRTRQLLIEAGELLNWNEINPDILGSMIQTVANAEARSTSGMHYTSVPNIMKVIKPLFLDNLRAAFTELEERADYYIGGGDFREEHRRKELRQILPKLEELLTRMASIKFLDPACGSGNFLIITYKELRRLEINILVKQREIRDSLNEKAVYQGELIADASKISLSQFSGIELDDFAHEVARLSLYIAEHQMNVEMEEALADVHPRLLPLREAGNIVCENALRIDWETVLNAKEDDEVYIFGNPPYIGASLQTQEQKNDLRLVTNDLPKTGKMDYIAGWFFKGAQLLDNSCRKLAFVTTNSIFQGEQVSIIWKSILKNIDIIYAYTSFKWGNSAKYNAGVTVSIVGMCKSNIVEDKYIYDDKLSRRRATNINPYLTDGSNIFVENTREPINLLPRMSRGNGPYDGGGLLFTLSEYSETIQKYPEITHIFKKFKSGEEMIKGTYRYALWLEENEYQKFKDNSIISERIERVRTFRQNAKSKSTKELADYPWRFGELKELSSQVILIPRVSSETREYVPMDFVMGKDMIISDAVITINNAPIWLLGILESKMHMVWLRSIGGKLKTDYRYSAGLVYNTFPIPELSEARKNMLEEAVFEMLDVREEEGGTLAELYGGANKPMNECLRQAHEKIDGIVERAYQQKPFESDEERLSVLLNLYKEMTEKEAK
ncbi:N-6 DNA methylase [Streptococcus mitis]|uniref:site-specific DNA-methyltransferase (adenine-specific) n=1 Tax=Streptococcus mitis TaxID=28037 RepID=A0A6I1UDB5_STRMT|nr:DNA methyltransferase [Streptococcus mitis]MQP82508.1 N-6 DNA methylase [Streptococcus mitis]MQQ40458.1 N-6 DNA methylase [Streptococcus mitis]MQQ61494.1 N-6 DNA methylase [Streptococcus mitis]